MFQKPTCAVVMAVVLLVGVPSQSAAEISYFGYSAVLCDLDDPHDSSTKTDYVDEVVGFTNINQVCLTDDTTRNGRRLRRAAQYFTPLLDVSSIFFEREGGGLKPTQNAAFLVQFLQESIQESQVRPDRLVFYLADEPTLNGLTSHGLTAAATTLKELYPETPILIIEAYHAEGPPPIPPIIDYWGFDAYAIPDPALEPLYTAYLESAARKLSPHQALVMVMDGNYTRYHRDAGISEDAMASVAKAYYSYAVSRGDIVMLLTYTWAGGIDNRDERGTRDLSPSIVKTHRWIGEQIVGTP